MARAKYRLDDLLTLEQVAEKLHVKVRTVRSWRHKRQLLTFTRVGRRLYVSAEAVENLLSRNEIPTLPVCRQPQT
ncbi:MAG: helix-turn-helix domain-containing protein [Planctomycetota bacterium]|nr:helix-turn-helix domain-containing protein [Planctomycetota bacterium]